MGRVIGRPEYFKSYARVLNCGAAGLAEIELPKRAAPFRHLDRTKAALLYRRQHDRQKIAGGTRLA